MLKVKKNKYAKSYENTFFREFARHLSKAFEKHGWSGLLIGSPVCEVEGRLQIDALLITEKVVCIIDFKNFGGQINIPDEHQFKTDIWTNSHGEQIKGGSYINPFLQLMKQKERFSHIFMDYVAENLYPGDKLDCGHIIMIVCFQQEIELNRQIPKSKELTFWIIDKTNFVEKIKDIIDVNDDRVHLTINSYNAFEKVFRADYFEIDEKPLEDKLKDFAEKSETLDYSMLRADQNVALSEIRSFLENPDQNVFILTGTTNSGKSFLIPYIQDIGFKLGIQEIEVFGLSSRVANNLISSTGIDKVNSIYSYIYGGKKSELDVNGEMVNEEVSGEDDEDENIQLESVPLKNCDNSDNALFIVDEAQLVSDSFYQSIDLIFGSGYVLKDFIEFSNLKNSKRKIIFIGDPYQLHIGNTDKTPLNPSHLEKLYNLKANTYQLYDNPEFSFITKQALICVEGIRSKHFNSLKFNESSSFCFIENESFKEKVTQLIKDGSGHLLYFSNADSQRVNLWIKKEILLNGDDIAKDDLVYFNNNISIEDENDPNATPKRIYNGQFAIVLEVSQNPIEEHVTIQEKRVIISFRELILKLNETGQKIKVLSLENYRLNPKAELSKDEKIALNIILNRLIKQYEKENPFEESTEYRQLVSSDKYQIIQREIDELKTRLNSGERVQGKLESKQKEQRKLLRQARHQYRLRIKNKLSKTPSSKYYKYRNVAMLRFGWAMTVHKSMSYKWNEVIFNVDPGESVGKTNEQYFRWLYTGISRAMQKVFLVNYKPISPFDQIQLVDEANIDNRKELFFYLAKSKEQEERQRELREFINSKIQGKAIQIERIENLNWQERFYFKRNNVLAVLSFAYNGRGQFRYPTRTNGDNDFMEEVMSILTHPNTTFDFDIIQDSWRKSSYKALANTLSDSNIRFTQIIQTQYRDTIKFSSYQDELDVDIDYDGSGKFTRATARYYSSSDIWVVFKNAVGKQID